MKHHAYLRMKEMMRRVSVHKPESLLPIVHRTPQPWVHKFVNSLYLNPTSYRSFFARSVVLYRGTFANSFHSLLRLLAPLSPPVSYSIYRNISPSKIFSGYVKSSFLSLHQALHLYYMKRHESLQLLQKIFLQLLLSQDSRSEQPYLRSVSKLRYR